MSSVENSLEPEIRAERDYLAACQIQLTRMREEISAQLATGAGEGEAVLDKYFNHMLRQFRIQVIEELSDVKGAPLFFGRLDFEAEGLAYVGRRGVRDDQGEPMVIDWRAPLARAFYEADREDPMGVRTRRRYGFDQLGELSAVEDEPVDQPGGTELLAAEIERPRVGPMRDIVATIQPEQMNLVRAPLDRTVCVQGAPGTGKTAIGLHRLAYLLYTERDRLRREGGVAVIGPNHAFLAYIRNVLPALGEVEVSQTTIDELIGAGLTVEAIDEPEVARVKGDARMAEVLRRRVWSGIQQPTETIEVKHLHRVWRLYSDEVAEEVEAVLGRGIDYGTGRELLAQRLAHLVLRQMERAGISSVTLAQLRRNRAISRAVGTLWPAIDPARLVFDVLTDPAPFAEGVLSADEQAALSGGPRARGVKSMRWSSLDLALVDEVAALVGKPGRLGHIVVDEAQDLSPMQFRAIARRLAGSVTVLGDLAQATSPAAVEDWAAVLTHLGRPAGWVEELTRGYRVPAQVIDFAARLLPFIAPELRGPVSFRQSPDALRVTRTTRERRAAACVTALAGAGSIGLIAADADVPELHRVLTENGVQHGILGTGPENGRITLVPVTLTKGLEFDTVVVVEPAHIAEAEPRGLQRLYVALTRAVSELHVIHAEELPEPLLRSDAARLASPAR